MVEREMQELLWRYPDRLLNEPLNQIAWEESSSVGRADLVFEDRHKRLLIVEVKRGKLPRGAIDQLLDYFGMIKQRFADRSVEMMVVANAIPSERRIACENRDIECREISEKKFREVAAEMGYVFRSDESPSPDSARNVISAETTFSMAEERGSKLEQPQDRRSGDALYVIVRHPQKPNEQGRSQWDNKWKNGRLESITTTKRLGELCGAEKEAGRVVYIYRCAFKNIPPVIICSARVGEVEYRGNGAVVKFITEKVLGTSGEGIPTTAEQRQAIKRQKYRYLPAPI